MSNRQTIYILMALAVIIGGVRIYVGSMYSTYKDAQKSHQAVYGQIWADVDDVRRRRKKIPYDDSESSIQGAFLKEASTFRLGEVNPKPTRSPSSRSQTYEDKAFGIEFERTDHAFQRQQIWKFCYNSELNIPRMRCTAVSLSPAPQGRSRKVDTGSDRPDLWRVSKLTFTQRTPKKKSTGNTRS